MFDPLTSYDVTFDSIPLRDFYAYWDDYVVRPPYQRKSVWSRKKKLALLDSLFRRYYVPRIVVRYVRLSDQKIAKEIIDGQQRITTAKEFFSDELVLPSSLKDVHASLPGKKYSQLPTELRKFVDKELKFNADVVKGIETPTNPDHQRIAADIFWRLQQGESLTFMEIAHARVASLSRNFIVKYADDISFDYTSYRPLDKNPHKHQFFKVIDRNNDRMQHLALLARLVILEENDGVADIRDTEVGDFIEKWEQPTGIGDESFESFPIAKDTLKIMNAFYKVFAADPMVKGGDGMKEFRIEYFIISFYLLLRHLLQYYVFGPDESKDFLKFTIAFHQRWRERRETDLDVLNFSDHRQHSAKDIEIRLRVLRQLFFADLTRRKKSLKTKDQKREFDESERIAIYRRDNGLCKMCLSEGKTPDESEVAWREYDADHVIPHSRGGQTNTANAQVLCRPHNLKKSAKVS
ncbi:MAG: HNH endonuclease family protein [Gemmatimonadaceae bacterium]